MDPFSLMAGAAVVVLAAAQASVLASCFKRCPPDQAMIVSGLGTAAATGAGSSNIGGRGFIIVRRGGYMVWPVVQQVSYLDLSVRKLTIKSNSPFITADQIPVSMEVGIQYRIEPDDASLAAAAECLLNKDAEEVGELVDDSLTGHLRAIVGRTPIDKLATDSQSFAKELISCADLKKMGIAVVTVAVKDFHDTVGYLEKRAREQSDSLNANR